MSRTVLATGGSGFVASHLVRQLLERGYRVRTTVRQLGHSAKVAPLARMAEAFPGKLDLADAELFRDGSFDAAMSGCEAVFHVASPFLRPEKIRDGRTDVLEPALQGTRNVLASVERSPTVRRVVLTSTVGAIFGDYIDVFEMKNQTLREEGDVGCPDRDATGAATCWAPLIGHADRRRIGSGCDEREICGDHCLLTRRNDDVV